MALFAGINAGSINDIDHIVIFMQENRGEIDVVLFLTCILSLRSLLWNNARSSRFWRQG